MTKNKKKKERFHFGKTNMILMILAIVFIIVGFTVVNAANNLGVILLVIGYLGLVPLSLLIKPKNGKNNTE